MTSITRTVVNLEPRKPRGKGKPAHWVDEKPTKFVNPWDSWRLYPAQDRIIPYMLFTTTHPRYPQADKVPLVPIKTPTWGENEKEEMIKSTWLGHACFLLELPAKPGEPRGARILFDPVFSKRCSSNQLVGPKRYTPAPCKINDIPDFDVIVISHNHYDHMDSYTLRTLFERPQKPHIFAPLGNASFLKSIKIPKDHIHILDWWDSKRVEVKIPYTENVPDELATLTFDLTCTPGQHFTGRTLWDDFKTLWSTWVIESPSPSTSTSTTGKLNATSDKDGAASREGVKIFFGGDTGYRAVTGEKGEDVDSLPTCPAFKEIGEVFGGFDFAMIPIGAYEPRKVMSPIHCAPQDSVCIFKDIRARKALGMHWGTWILTTEEVTEPPNKLAEECEKAGIETGDFGVCDIGETRFW
ncbi:hypothetical protein AX17_003631 [Amanita inopinata Kibby_2008]|nr:hypothetical protein AX17_003631 [Amanita inopinata Kibby_2008]